MKHSNECFFLSIILKLELEPQSENLLTLPMTKKERYRFVIDYFLQHTPNAETELIYDNPYQLLVSVILSAQCTDKRVNLTTPAIF